MVGRAATLFGKFKKKQPDPKTGLTSPKSNFIDNDDVISCCSVSDDDELAENAKAEFEAK